MTLDELIRAGAPDRAVAEEICAAVAELFDRDADLFQVDANERSITHQLAVHLAPRFPDWHVDCEYNRDGFDPKVVDLVGPDNDPEGVHGSRIYPDIIIHHRRKPENLIVLEVKKSTSNRSDNADLAKLRALRQQLGYRLALFLRFGCGQAKPTLERIVWT